MQSFAYFPTLVYRDEKPEWLYKFKKYLNEYSGPLLEQSSFVQTHDISGAPELAPFVEYLACKAGEILRQEGYAVDRYKPTVCVWGQDVYKGAGTNVHTHKNSQLSGWMFLDVPRGGSFPIYYDPRVRKPLLELEYEATSDINVATPSIHFSNINPGTILIASSWLEHELTRNSNDLPTTCLHFTVSYQGV
jgi:hypothetical protein